MLHPKRNSLENCLLGKLFNVQFNILCLKFNLILLQPLELLLLYMQLKLMETLVVTLTLKRMKVKSNTSSSGRVGLIFTAHGRVKNPYSNRK